METNIIYVTFQVDSQICIKEEFFSTLATTRLV